MKERPTPQTDRVFELFNRNACSAHYVAKVMGEIERELAYAIAERDDALTMLGVYKLGCDEQKKELANLRARLESDAAIADWKRKNGKA